MSDKTLVETSPGEPAFTDFSKLCVHTITTKPWAIEEAADHYSRSGMGGISVWRDALANRNIQKTGQLLRDHNLSVVSPNWARPTSCSFAEPHRASR
jgi:hypothetical protein